MMLDLRSSFKLQASSFWECSRTFRAIALHGSRHVYSSQRAGVSCAASKAPKKTTKPKKAAVKKEPEEAKDVEAEKVEAETVDEETAQKGDYVEVAYSCHTRHDTIAEPSMRLKGLEFDLYFDYQAVYTWSNDSNEPLRHDCSVRTHLSYI
jgi:hypothetical protein